MDKTPKWEKLRVLLGDLQKNPEKYSPQQKDLILSQAEKENAYKSMFQAAQKSGKIKPGGGDLPLPPNAFSSLEKLPRKAPQTAGEEQDYWKIVKDASVKELMKLHSQGVHPYALAPYVRQLMQIAPSMDRKLYRYDELAPGALDLKGAGNILTLPREYQQKYPLPPSAEEYIKGGS